MFEIRNRKFDFLGSGKVFMTRKLMLQKEVKRMVGILVKKYQPQKVILFGSFVHGDVHEWSDLDIVIVRETDKRIYDRIAEVVELCKPVVAVDFIVYTPKEFEQMQIEEPFVHDEIVEKGKILYEAA